MKELLIIAVGSAPLLTTSYSASSSVSVLSLGVSKKIETAAGMGGAVVFVITIRIFHYRCDLPVHLTSGRI